jgi:hypothetical protein
MLGLLPKSARDQVTGVILVADAEQHPFTGGLRKGTAPGWAAGVVGLGAVGLTFQPIPQEYEDRTIIVCNAGDLVCDTSDVAGGCAMWLRALLCTGGLANGFSVHTHYNADDLEGYGRTIGSWTRDAILAGQKSNAKASVKPRT